MIHDLIAGGVRCWINRTTGRINVADIAGSATASVHLAGPREPDQHALLQQVQPSAVLWVCTSGCTSNVRWKFDDVQRTETPTATLLHGISRRSALPYLQNAMQAVS